MLNTRYLSLVISLFVSLTTYFILGAIEGVTEGVKIKVFLIEFCVIAAILFFLLEVFVYKELRKIFRLFEKQKGSKRSSYQYSEISLEKLGKELFTYAKDKQQEIEKLKELETFRREFLADISHELKTPLFAAQGYIDTLIDGAAADDNLREKFLSKSAKSLDYLNNLIADLLIISQVETGEIIMDKVEFDIKYLIDEVFEKVESRADFRDISLERKYDESKPFIVVGDEQRIGQVLTNLIENAVKYGYDDGHVWVSLRKESDKLLISIKDDGLGISEVHHEKIFKRLYRVDKSRSKEKGGTGLGLAIVKHIVEAHNSKVVLSSEPEKGSEFTFTLKLIEN